MELQKKYTGLFYWIAVIVRNESSAAASSFDLLWNVDYAAVLNFHYVVIEETALSIGPQTTCALLSRIKRGKNMF